MECTVVWWKRSSGQEQGVPAPALWELRQFPSLEKEKNQGMARDCPQGSSWLRYARILYPKISSLFLLAIGICHLGNQIHGKRSSRKTYSHTLMRPKYKASGSGDRNESPVRFFFFFLGPYLRKFLCYRLNQSYSCWPTPQPHQCQIQTASAPYTMAHRNTRSLTH